MTTGRPDDTGYGLRERAKRIAAIRSAKNGWDRGCWPFWRNHTTASHEFQMLDVLRDIRLALTFILILLAMIAFDRPDAVIHLDGEVNTAHKNSEVQ